MKPTRWKPDRLRWGSLRRAPAKRAGWAIGDQALSSLTNFGVALVAARNLNQAEFGAFAFAFSVYILGITIVRGVGTTPLTIRYSGAPNDVWQKATRAATGMVVLLAAAGGMTSVFVGAYVGGETGSALTVLGFGLVPLLLQDAWRYAFFSARRASTAFLNDAVFALTLAMVLGVLYAVGTLTLELVIAAWAVSGLAAALLGVIQSGAMPRLTGASSWWKEHADIGPHLAIEGLLSATMAYALFGIAAVAGLAATGAVRGAQVLMNLLHVPMYGAHLAALPEAVRLLKESRRAVITLSVVLGVSLAALAAIWGLVLLALPETAGYALLGDSWHGARSVILPMTIVTANQALQLGATVGLRAFAWTGKSLSARGVTSLLVFAAGLVGAHQAGSTGAGWGMALAMTASTVIWWRLFLGWPRGHGERFLDVDSDTSGETAT